MGTLEGANATFQKPSGTSAHYGISDTRVWQWVKEEHVAYHAGNYVVNQKSIGIEHDANPDKLLSEASYQTSGRLVAEICKRYNIPLDRTHIIKHSEVPRNTQCSGSIDIDKIIRIAKGETMPELIQIEKKDFEKLMMEAREKDKTIEGLNKETNVLKTSLEEKSGQITTQGSEIATLGKQVSAQKGLVTQSEKAYYLQGIELSEAKSKIKKLEKAEPIEAIKDPMRYVVSLVIGAVITWAYTQYPFLGQLGGDQQSVAAFLIGLAVKGLDKYQFETGSKVKLPF